MKQRIVKIKWDIQQEYPGQITTKRHLFNELGLLSDTPAILQQVLTTEKLLLWL